MIYFMIYLPIRILFFLKKIVNLLSFEDLNDLFRDLFINKDIVLKNNQLTLIVTQESVRTWTFNLPVLGKYALTYYKCVYIWANVSCIKFQKDTFHQWWREMHISGGSLNNCKIIIYKLQCKKCVTLLQKTGGSLDASTWWS